MKNFIHNSTLEVPKILAEFCWRQGIELQNTKHLVLHHVTRAFSKIPYENLTKILHASQNSNKERRRRLPSEVLADYYRFGTGGTCFSLTWTLLHLIREIGFNAEPILADRHYGPDTHCALLVWIDDKPHLLDPGYLLIEPVALTQTWIATSIQQIHLKADDICGKIQLFTKYAGQLKYRLTYKTNPVDASQFLQAWDHSFNFDMMAYPVISIIKEDTQYYLQKTRLLIRKKSDETILHVDSQELPVYIQRYFAIEPELAWKAIHQLKK
ncbi:MAG TPA: arylamine N-acetyltransferase [Gemmatales bacterium]|nr:arylamine N-acetyltransferase [Gemmatales bacterium]HMP15512.1 arylamine N-acetyltransferase [Gemmatales bacterium]